MQMQKIKDDVLRLFTDIFRDVIGEPAVVKAKLAKLAQALLTAAQFVIAHTPGAIRFLRTLLQQALALVCAIIKAVAPHARVARDKAVEIWQLLAPHFQPLVPHLRKGMEHLRPVTDRLVP